MSIMQRLDLTFTDDTQKNVIIHEYGDKFVMMITDDGLFRYFPQNDKPKIYDTAQEAFEEISKLWNFSEAISIKTTNEFIKVEDLKVMFDCGVEYA